MAEKVMIELVDHGVSRDEAHEIMRDQRHLKLSQSGEELLDVCARYPGIVSCFSIEELESMFEPANISVHLLN